jgi:GAF domain-containing protein
MPLGNARVLRLWLPAAYREYVEQCGVHSMLATALVRHGQVLGTLLLWREDGQPAFVEDDQAYVCEVAARVSLGLSHRLS